MHKAQGAVQRCVLCHIPCPVAQLPPVTLLGNVCTAAANSSQALAGSWPCRGWGVPDFPERGNHGPWGRKRLDVNRVVAPDSIPDQQVQFQSGSPARRLTGFCTSLHSKWSVLQLFLTLHPVYKHSILHGRVWGACRRPAKSADWAKTSVPECCAWPNKLAQTAALCC